MTPAKAGSRPQHPIELASHHETRPFLAIGLRLLAMLTITIMFARVKWAKERGVHIVETMFYRQLFGMPVALAGVMIGPGIGGAQDAEYRSAYGPVRINFWQWCWNLAAISLLPLAGSDSHWLHLCRSLPPSHRYSFLASAQASRRWAAVI